jgi:hypothetical protein
VRREYANLGKVKKQFGNPEMEISCCGKRKNGKLGSGTFKE